MRIQDGLETIASHARSFDKGAQVEEAAHIDQLRDYKRRAKARSVLDYLHRAAPSVADFLQRAVERDASIAKMTSRLRGLLDRYGAKALEDALREALDCDAPHVGAVHQVLETNRKARGEPPPVHRHIEDPRIIDIVVEPHDIKKYDHLTENSDDDDTTD